MQVLEDGERGELEDLVLIGGGEAPIAPSAIRADNVKVVVVAPNIDEGSTLAKSVDEILDAARDMGVPVVFALGKRKLGRALRKSVGVSAVGVRLALLRHACREVVWLREASEARLHGLETPNEYADTGLLGGWVALSAAIGELLAAREAKARPASGARPSSAVSMCSVASGDSTRQRRDEAARFVPLCRAFAISESLAAIHTELIHTRRLTLLAVPVLPQRRGRTLRSRPLLGQRGHQSPLSLGGLTACCLHRSAGPFTLTRTPLRRLAAPYVISKVEPNVPASLLPLPSSDSTDGNQNP